MAAKVIFLDLDYDMAMHEGVDVAMMTVLGSRNVDNKLGFWHALSVEVDVSAKTAVLALIEGDTRKESEALFTQLNGTRVTR